MTDLNQAALEAAASAWVREMLKNSRRADLMTRFEAGGIEEVRKWMDKNPATVNELRVAISAYLGAAPRREAH